MTYLALCKMLGDFAEQLRYAGTLVGRNDPDELRRTFQGMANRLDVVVDRCIREGMEPLEADVASDVEE